MERIISTLEKDGAVLFPPAEDRSIRFVSSMLTSHKFAAIPSQYGKMLKQADGLIWNGVELYGTRAVEREELGYVFPGLIEANLEFLGYEAINGKLIIGRAAEELFIFNARERRYQVLDRLDFSLSGSFISFREAINSFVNELF
ncbi:MAG: YrhA family protein [Alphaproteobacteria bacterium]|nr:YrhA family protein [Alphaproteobacteria bacterium]